MGRFARSNARQQNSKLAQLTTTATSSAPPQLVDALLKLLFQQQAPQAVQDLPGALKPSVHDIKQGLKALPSTPAPKALGRKRDRQTLITTTASPEPLYVPAAAGSHRVEFETSAV